jgi:hypothetical protein
MKRIFIVLTLGIIFMTSRYLNHIEEEKHTYIISLLKYHYVVDSVKESIIISLFISDDRHPLTQLEYIDRIQIKNDVINFDVFIHSITMSHQETKDDITYHMIDYELRVPRLNVELYLKNIYCLITLHDGSTHTFKIGALEMFLKPNVFDATWSEIQAVRHQDIVSIHYIDIITKEDVTLSMSSHIETTTTKHEHGYYMYIPKSDIIYLDIPIIINTNENIEMIIGVKWLSSKRMLNQTEGYFVIYHLYKNQSREAL